MRENCLKIIENLIAVSNSHINSNNKHIVKDMVHWNAQPIHRHLDEEHDGGQDMSHINYTESPVVIVAVVTDYVYFGNQL